VDEHPLQPMHALFPLTDSLRPGNARRKVRGRNHVQLPMISYIWLT